MELHEYTKQFRATGRTIRAECYAIKLAEEGYAVTLVVPEGMYEHSRTRMAFNRVLVNERKNLAHGRVFVTTKVSSVFNFVTMKEDGYDGISYKWVIDHYVIECNPQFQAMFRAMTQFNKESSDAPTISTVPREEKT